MDAHTFSFYLPALTAEDRSLRITGDEHRHLRRVLRIRAGEVIRVSNGNGLVVRARVESLDDRAAEARVLEVETNEAPSPRLVLALPLLARAHFDLAIAQCVELGVTGLIPVLAEKCHVRAWSPAVETRARRVAVAAMKQCGRGWLPPFSPALDVDGVAAALGAWPTVLLADADGDVWEPGLATGDVLAISGPEGGFSARERERLVAAGALPVSISRHRLRAETAAAVLVSLIALRPPVEPRTRN